MNDISLPIQVRFFIALGLSLLIGLERESSGVITKGRVFAGVRTYSLIGVFGFACGWLVKINIPWALPIGMISLAAIAIVGYLAKLKNDFVGWTSEVAALLTFVMGALCLLTDIWVPLALGIVGTFLLSEKAMFEHYVERLNNAEFLAVVKFMLITLIILPVLPDKAYTQFDLNPRRIWQIVVLVSTVGFGAERERATVDYSGQFDHVHSYSGIDLVCETGIRRASVAEIVITYGHRPDSLY
jgi:hypothetical protein